MFIVNTLGYYLRKVRLYCWLRRERNWSRAVARFLVEMLFEVFKRILAMRRFSERRFQQSFYGAVKESLLRFSCWNIIENGSVRSKRLSN